MLGIAVKGNMWEIWFKWDWTYIDLRYTKSTSMLNEFMLRVDAKIWCAASM
jgi:hypothetical protein